MELYSIIKMIIMGICFGAGVFIGGLAASYLTYRVMEDME